MRAAPPLPRAAPPAAGRSASRAAADFPPAAHAQGLLEFALARHGRWPSRRALRGARGRTAGRAQGVRGGRGGAPQLLQGGGAAASPPSPRCRADRGGLLRRDGRAHDGASADAVLPQRHVARVVEGVPAHRRGGGLLRAGAVRRGRPLARAFGVPLRHQAGQHPAVVGRRLQDRGPRPGGGAQGVERAGGGRKVPLARPARVEALHRRGHLLLRHGAVRGADSREPAWLGAALGRAAVGVGAAAGRLRRRDGAPAAEHDEPAARGAPLR
mmetsp:Transcript_47562/g.154039  ORF Transcript_47562/g.154039 Transcript_47562/m.154039 type:complete len:270 (-) Transcript_47562:322-1131(-)